MANWCPDDALNSPEPARFSQKSRLSYPHFVINHTRICLLRAQACYFQYIYSGLLQYDYLSAGIIGRASVSVVLSKLLIQRIKAKKNEDVDRVSRTGTST